LKIKLPHIAFEITNQCNLRCLYCYNPWKTCTSPTPVLNSYTKAIKTLKQLFKIAEINNISFTGGEPFISERFLEVVLFCRMKNKTVTIISNGNVGTRDNYKTLISLGVSLFEFPLHAKDEKPHDQMTCVKGSWQKSFQSINDVISLGGYVVPVIVITKKNHQLIEETLSFFNSLGLKRIMMNRYNIGGSGIANADKLMISKAELNETFFKANKLSKELGLKITSNVCTPFCLVNPKDYDNIGFGACSKNTLLRPITLNIEGDIRLCNHSPIVAGNIFKNNIETIIKSGYAESWLTIKPDYCSTCLIYEKCRGGCRAASEQLGLPLSEVDPVLTLGL